MGRSTAKAIQQPNDRSCGPTALKTALSIFGQKRSLPFLTKLCKTSRNGTTTHNLIGATIKLGYSVELVEGATLTHLASSLRYSKNKIRVTLVSYLYDLDEKQRPHPDSGHWAVVSSYSASKSRIYLLDSSTATRKSYDWPDFRNRWMDYDFKRIATSDRKKSFKMIRHWQPQLMLVIAKKEDNLPQFNISSSRIFTP
jgi:ABC-type bacteriocin/lantibiotic exporter with double-glycine peptidase domain